MLIKFMNAIAYLIGYSLFTFKEPKPMVFATDFIVLGKLNSSALVDLLGFIVRYMLTYTIF